MNLYKYCLSPKSTVYLNIKKHSNIKERNKISKKDKESEYKNVNEMYALTCYTQVLL